METSSRRWTWRGAFLAAAGIALLVVFWVNFAPVHLGGNSIYVVTSGISMEPRFHTGDLAVLHPSRSYHVGEIVGYLSPRIGIVLHRIIAERAGHFYMKGDNNHFVDPYHPLPSDVVGRLWLHIPKIGRLVSGPGGRALAALAASASVASVVVVPPMRRHRSGSRSRAGSGPGGRRARRSRLLVHTLATPGQLVASVLALLLLASLAFGAVAFDHRTSTITTREMTYRQSGAWTYRAPSRGDVYSGSFAVTGDPLFVKVAPVARVRFVYHFGSTLGARLSGRGQLVATVSSADGWTRRLLLGPEREFSGPTATLTGTLDLPAIERLLASVRAQTGQAAGSGSGSYALVLDPQVHVSGVLGGSSLLHTGFDPALSFTLDASEAQVNYGSVGSGSVSPAVLFAPSTPSTIGTTEQVPTYLSAFGHHMRVAVARRASEWAVLGSFLALVIFAFLAWRASMADEDDRIRARYGSLLVAIAPLASSNLRSELRVERFEELVKIAEGEGRMILHFSARDRRQYLVQSDDVVYVYMSDASALPDPESVPTARPGALGDRLSVTASEGDV